MDVKAVEGLRLYASLWPGPVRCLTRAFPDGDQPYFKRYAKDELPFEVEFIADFPAARKLLDDSAAILAAADNHLDIPLVRATDAPVVYVIESTLRTRLQIVRMSKAAPIEKAKTAVWLVGMERRRRNALKRARGLQANGAPAYYAYRRLNARSLLYFDSRLPVCAGASAEQVARKRDHVLSGGPLKLAFSGRLERIKGADYLIPFADALRRRGTVFTLQIFGEGALRPEMEAAVGRLGLSDRVLFRGPVSFEERLVPAFKDEVDLFICCHPQGDPSCTYLETLGCGVPIAGFANPALTGVLALGRCGVSVKVGDTEALADAVFRLASDRRQLADLVEGARSAAEGHFFEQTFERRVNHIREAVGL